MAKAPTLPNITGQFASSGQLNQAFRDIEDAFENTISRDGSLPNTMEADLDLNGNSLLNVDTIDVDNLSIAGLTVTDLASVPEWRSTWSGGTAYVENDLVKINGNVYICLVPHVSGTFSTDLSALRWELFVERGAAGVGTGDVLSTNNLSELTDKPLALSTIGGQPADADLTAIAGLSSNGLITRISNGNATTRSVAAGSGLSVTNADGVSGNPTISFQSRRLAGSGGASTNDNETPSSAWVREAIFGYLSVNPATGGGTIFPARSVVNFHGVPTNGTYSRTGTLITVTMTAHGMSTGARVSLDFTTGTATDGTYDVTVVDANTFTVTDTVSGSTSGNVTRNVWIRMGRNISSVIRNGTGDYTITFFTALSSADYAVNVSCNLDNADTPPVAGSTWARVFPTNPTTTSVGVGVVNSGGTALVDAPMVSVVVFI